MRLFTVALILACNDVVLAPLASAAVPSPAQVAGIFHELQGLDRPGCSVGIMREGRLVHAAAYGSADLAARAPLEAQTVYNIASVSKQFTAFALLLLEQRGRLSLDDPIRKYVPELGSYADGVTLRHLLHHIGGLRDYVGLLRLEGRRYTERATREQALEVLSRQQSANALPGTAYEYSNTGFFLLGVVVERVSGRSLGQFSRENIFMPLGMADTSIVERYPAGIGRLAHGYSPATSGFEIDESLWEQTGDGQVHTSVEDLARWESNFLTGKVGGRDLIRRMLEPARLASGERVSYGAGLRLGNYRGLPTVRHGGDWAGYGAHFLRFPEQRFAVAVLCNRSDVQPSSHAAALADLYLADQLQTADVASQVHDLRSVRHRVDPARMQTGLYRNEMTARHLRLVIDGGAVRVESDGVSSSLIEVEPGIFWMRELAEAYAVFVPAARGRPAHIVTRNSPQAYVFELAPQWQPPSLGAYAGIYDSAEARVRYEILARNGALLLDTGATQLPLEPMTPNEFAGRGLPEQDEGFTLRFLDPSEGFLYFSDGLRGLRFARHSSTGDSGDRAR